MSMFSVVAKKVANYNDNKSIGSKFRRKRLEMFIPLINKVFEEYGQVNIIDIGGTKTYWNIIEPSMLDEKNINITLVNMPGTNLPTDEKHFSYIEADACDLSTFEDESFHIAHSNSVVEHVGDWRR